MKHYPIYDEFGDMVGYFSGNNPRGPKLRCIMLTTMTAYDMALLDQMDTERDDVIELAVIPIGGVVKRKDKSGGKAGRIKLLIVKEEDGFRLARCKSITMIKRASNILPSRHD